MRAAEHVHSLLLHFEIEMDSGAIIPRFVPAYVIDADGLPVVDTGVESSAGLIFSYIESPGRRPEEIEYVIDTHGHFGHAGGNGIFAERAGPRFFAHPLDRGIIENLEYRGRIRPAGKCASKTHRGRWR
jgi:glyoxylase-like metal-dependent hydrolase (beta-lactamase superfamily II)